MFRKPISLIVAITFVCSLVTPVPKAQAQNLLGLPEPGVMVSLSPAFEPALIKGLTVHKDNPFLFDFIVDNGNSHLAGDALKKEGDRLIKYFFAALTIPDKDLWVNLSPYEKDRMIPQALGQTALGRDLLAQDYMLKQLTASLIYPEKELGKSFWDKVYAQAREQFGTINIPVNTFNKVWIIAEKASVYEHNQTAFIVSGHLKVMLEEDYLSLQKHTNTASSHTLASQIVRSIILPAIENEVNTGKNFAMLRQMFYSQILATWFKHNLKQALLSQVYADKSTVNGVNLQDPSVKEKIYQRYLQAYKKGAFNFIKEDVDPVTQQSIPRKYFSGGERLAPATIDAATLSQARQAAADMAQVVDVQTMLYTGPEAEERRVAEKAEGGGKDSAMVATADEIKQAAQEMLKAFKREGYYTSKGGVGESARHEVLGSLDKKEMLERVESIPGLEQKKYHPVPARFGAVKAYLERLIRTGTLDAAMGYQENVRDQLQRARDALAEINFFNVGLSEAAYRHERRQLEIRVATLKSELEGMGSREGRASNATMAERIRAELGNLGITSEQVPDALNSMFEFMVILPIPSLGVSAINMGVYHNNTESQQLKIVQALIAVINEFNPDALETISEPLVNHVNPEDKIYSLEVTVRRTLNLREPEQRVVLSKVLADLKSAAAGIRRTNAAMLANSDEIITDEPQTLRADEVIDRTKIRGFLSLSGALKNEIIPLFSPDVLKLLTEALRREVLGRSKIFEVFTGYIQALSMTTHSDHIDAARFINMRMAERKSIFLGFLTDKAVLWLKTKVTAVKSSLLSQIHQRERALESINAEITERGLPNAAMVSPPAMVFLIDKLLIDRTLGRGRKQNGRIVYNLRPDEMPVFSEVLKLRNVNTIEIQVHENSFTVAESNEQKFFDHLEEAKNSMTARIIRQDIVKHLGITSSRSTSARMVGDKTVSIIFADELSSLAWERLRIFLKEKGLRGDQTDNGFSEDHENNKITIQNLERYYVSDSAMIIGKTVELKDSSGNESDRDYVKIYQLYDVINAVEDLLTSMRKGNKEFLDSTFSYPRKYPKLPIGQILQRLFLDPDTRKSLPSYGIKYSHTEGTNWTMEVENPVAAQLWLETLRDSFVKEYVMGQEDRVKTLIAKISDQQEALTIVSVNPGIEGRDQELLEIWYRYHPVPARVIRFLTTFFPNSIGNGDANFGYTLAQIYANLNALSRAYIDKITEGNLVFNNWLDEVRGTDPGNNLIAGFPISSGQPGVKSKIDKRAEKIILFVDDDQYQRKAAKIALIEAGYNVVIKDDGQEALDYLSAGGLADLVISDGTMPKLTGHGLFNGMRSKGIMIPFILRSGAFDPHMSESRDGRESRSREMTETLTWANGVFGKLYYDWRDVISKTDQILKIDAAMINQGLLDEAYSKLMDLQRQIVEANTRGISKELVSRFLSTASEDPMWSILEENLGLLIDPDKKRTDLPDVLRDIRLGEGYGRSQHIPILDTDEKVAKFKEALAERGFTRWTGLGRWIASVIALDNLEKTERQASPTNPILSVSQWKYFRKNREIMALTLAVLRGQINHFGPKGEASAAMLAVEGANDNGARVVRESVEALVEAHYGITFIVLGEKGEQTGVVKSINSKTIEIDLGEGGIKEYPVHLIVVKSVKVPIDMQYEPLTMERFHGDRDHVQTTRGGIDLNTLNNGLSVTKDANGGVVIKVDLAMIERIRREGISNATPVIINMRFLPSVDQLLGL